MRKARSSDGYAPARPARTRAREQVLSLAGRDVVIRARRSRRARRMTLRIDPKGDCAILTLPSFVPLEQGMGFARSKADWLVQRLSALPPLTPFCDDAKIPYRGEDILIRLFPLAGRKPVLAGRELHVPGPAERIADDVRNWLIGQARAVITGRVTAKVQEIGRSGTPPIRLTDPRSRWGSCSSAGRLAFSWRLIMAPDSVLDYVVAHEVAHLEELNHGKRFHALVADLAGDSAAPQAWLARMGAGLLRYG